MRYYILSSSIVAVLASCAPKVMILQSPVVSMMEANAGSTKDFGSGQPVDSKWCADEEPVTANDDGSKHYGMIDQAIWKAHKSTNAKFFKDAKFYQQGTCVTMTAEAVNAGAGNGAESAPQQQGAESQAPVKKAPAKTKK